MKINGLDMQLDDNKYDSSFQSNITKPMMERKISVQFHLFTSPYQLHLKPFDHKAKISIKIDKISKICRKMAI